MFEMTLVPCADACIVNCTCDARLSGILRYVACASYTVQHACCIGSVNAQISLTEHLMADGRMND